MLRRLAYLQFAVASLAAAGCGASSRTQAGEDDPDAGRPRDCSVAQTEGCPCDAPEPVVCYAAPAETIDVGPCRPGIRACLAGLWGPCDGQILPTVETCDGNDDDCDGAVDEGVVSECGTCDPDCGTVAFGAGPGQTPFTEGNYHGAYVRPSGELTFDCIGRYRDCMWIPNSAAGTISLVDTSEVREIGRFHTGPNGAADDPSRTAVSWIDTDVFVANRAPGAQASVTRIHRAHCPDLDHDGAIQTSTGREDLLPWGEDECVAWNAPVGGIGAIATAVSEGDYVGLDGALDRRLWVGLAAESRYLELDVDTGEETGRSVDTAPCVPAGSTGGPDRDVWSTCESAHLFRFSVSEPEEDHEWIEAPGPALGIAYDGDIWIGGPVSLYDTEAETWTSLGFDGVGIGFGGGPRVWIGGCSVAEGGTCYVDPRTFEVTPFVDVPSQAVALDVNQRAWTLPTSGVVHIIEADRGLPAVVEPALDCGGAPCLDGPDAYGNLAGSGLTHECDWATWSADVEGCGAGQETTWTAVTWDADTNRGDFSISVSTADTREGLRDGLFFHLGHAPRDSSPLNLTDLLGRSARSEWLHVSLTLYGDPVIRELGLQRSCR